MRLLHSLINKLKNSYINFWKDKIHDDSKNQPNGNKLRTYRIFKKCYARDTYLFVNELSKSELSTFAKLLSSHDLHIETDRHRKTEQRWTKCIALK